MMLCDATITRIETTYRCLLAHGHTGNHQHAAGFIRVTFTESETDASRARFQKTVSRNNLLKLKYGIVWERYPALLEAFASEAPDHPCWRDLEKLLEDLRDG